MQSPYQTIRLVVHSHIRVHKSVSGLTGQPCLGLIHNINRYEFMCVSSSRGHKTHTHTLTHRHPVSTTSPSSSLTGYLSVPPFACAGVRPTTSGLTHAHACARSTITRTNTHACIHTHKNTFRHTAIMRVCESQSSCACLRAVYDHTQHTNNSMNCLCCIRARVRVCVCVLSV